MLFEWAVRYQEESWASDTKRRVLKIKKKWESDFSVGCSFMFMTFSGRLIGKMTCGSFHTAARVGP